MGTTVVEPTAMSQGLRALLWTVVYAAAFAAGRTIVDEPSGMALVWPAVAVGYLWLASGTSRRELTADLALMTVGGLVASALVGDGWLGPALALISTAECLVVLLVARRLLPGLWGGGGRRMLRVPGEFGRLLAAMSTGALAAAILRVLTRLVSGDRLDWWLIPERFGRDIAALAGIGTVGVLVGGWLAQRHDARGGAPPSLHWARGRIIHAVAVTVLTALVFAFGFVQAHTPGMSFVLTLLVVWVAIVFEPLLVSGYCLVTGVVASFLTIAGYGPIAALQHDLARVIITQLLVIVLMVIGMTISLTRSQLLHAIADLRSSEAERAARVEELDLLVEHLADGVAIVERGGRVVHTNAKLRELVAQGGPDAVANLREGLLVHGFVVFDRDGARVNVEDRPSIRALAGEVVNAEEYLLTADPNSTVVQISAVPLPQANGTGPRAMVMIRDVTVEAQARDTLVEFAGTVAHDLHNPLTVVDGWAETLEDLLTDQGAVSTTAAMPMLVRIRESVQTMRTFVADLLTHAVARDQSLRGEQVSLDTVVKRVMLTRDRPGTTSPVHAGKLPHVWGDRLMVQQLFDNLIGNALKYARPGVPPYVSVTARADEEGWVFVEVCDNGIGIPDDQRDLVFRSFHRVDPAAPGGTGLGLSICKRIVERHGGTIGALPNPDGPGTCIELTMPTTPAAFAAATRNGGG